MALMFSALMISVAPSVPPVSVHQSHLSMPINATCQCPSVHINTTYQCPSELLSLLPISASQCRLSVPVSAAYEC
ncbi:unnamed protein product [Staurois parvus]|uniref:REJ domain-containing protein n=1 Tax=Staurois parvus TaxID=386267 RepID=A0ABN9BDD1_9NEOB|nr:unnamed protein product [Staurois parvus]